MTRVSLVRRVLPVILAGAAVLFLLDIVGALTGRPLGFPYPRLGVISLLVYFGVGALSAWRGSFSDGLAASILVGLLDGTLGPVTAWLIGPGPVNQTVAEPGIFAYQIAVVTGTAAAAGLIGSLAGSWLERRRTIRGVALR
ncbi:MAG: hypothetical protein ACJ8BF_04015 [Gemmatimonadales bacterium]